MSTHFFKKGLSTIPQVIFFGSPFMEWILVHVPPVSMPRPGLAFSFSKEVLFFINSSRVRGRSLLIVEIQFPMLSFLRLLKVSQKCIDSLLTYFHLPTWAVYLCGAAVEQPLQVMVYCISVVSYDRCAIHRNFPMTCLL